MTCLLHVPDACRTPPFAKTSAPPATGSRCSSPISTARRRRAPAQRVLPSRNAVPSVAPASINDRQPWLCGCAHITKSIYVCIYIPGNRPPWRRRNGQSQDVTPADADDNVGQRMATGIIDDEHLPRVVGRCSRPISSAGGRADARTIQSTTTSAACGVGGYARAEWPSPGAYPRANAPQLWNASVFSMLTQSMLGPQPVAAALVIIDPVLPDWCPR